MVSIVSTVEESQNVADRSFFVAAINKNQLLEQLVDFYVRMREQNYSKCISELLNPELDLDLDINSSLHILVSAATVMSNMIKEENLLIDYIIGIPYEAIFLSAFVGERINLPLLLCRKEPKGHGTKKLIEGNFKEGQKVVIIEAVVATGESILKTAEILREYGLLCTEAFCLIDQQKGGPEYLKKNAITLYSAIKAEEMLKCLKCKDQNSDGTEEERLNDCKNDLIFRDSFDMNNGKELSDVTQKDHIFAEYAALEVFKVGQFQLKSGILSPIYVDFRGLISSQKTLHTTALVLSRKVYEENIRTDYIIGVPYGAMLLSAFLGEKLNLPLLVLSKETTGDGKKKLISKHFEKGKTVLVIEDVVTTGSSILETAVVLRQAGLICKEAICILDREQGGLQNLQKQFIDLHRLYTMTDVLNFMVESKKLTLQEQQSAVLSLINAQK